MARAEGAARRVASGARTFAVGCRISSARSQLVILKTKKGTASPCRYRHSGTGKTVRVKRRHEDWTVGLYERRSGKLMSKKHFKADRPTCAKVTGTTTTEHFSSPSAGIVGWAKKIIATQQ